MALTENVLEWSRAEGARLHSKRPQEKTNRVTPTSIIKAGSDNR